VIERLEDNNLFLVLSSEAAESIGIGYGDIFYGNISEQDNTNPLREEELPYNPDPDVNPSAASENYSELALIQNYIDNELGGSDDTLLVSNVADPIEVIPESTDSEPFKEPELVEITIPDESSVEVIEKPEVEELVEDPEIIEEDIPSVDNMPMEEIYISELKDTLPAPELVEAAPDSEDSVPELVMGVEEDIPVIIGMSADVPVRVAPADVRGVLPELPVPETDFPVFTSVDTGVVEELLNGVPSVQLPELPIIELEIVEEEIPIAVTMADDIVPLEDLEEITYLLPDLVKPGNDDIPDIAALSTDEPETEHVITMEIADPEIIIPEEEIVISDDLELPADLEMEVEVVLEPSDLRPPVLPDETEIVETEDFAPVVEVEVIPDSTITEPVEVAENYNVTRVLAEGSYYLQIGVYREQYSALDLAGRLGGTYPVTVLVSENMDILNYKVMVGPLGQDESGAVLYSFKSTGYPDAFLRKGL
ncbi:MAG: SPOR domain-containing protein, partial [Spirochaetales bacterium]|nr:SPOR domain-containing protein [Spirochaetales bacterium]